MKTALPTTTARERPRLNDVFSKVLSDYSVIDISMLRNTGYRTDGDKNLGMLLPRSVYEQRTK